MPSRSCGLRLGLMLGLLPVTTPALSLNRNAAHIEWRTAETEHFRFHYPKELEEVAGYVAGIAESVAPEKIQRYRIQLPNKVEFTLRDDIFSNGWANSLENTMNIWVTDWDFPIRSTHNWLKDVVTHEFSHLVSIQSGSKLPAYVQGLVIGYQDYFNEPTQGNLATIVPFTEQPNWFAEGVAQYESALSGFDAWDSHRDMILRTAALQGKLIPIERMGTFTGNSLEYEQGPYTQGFSLVRFIAARYGDAAVVNLWNENSRLHRQTMSGCTQAVLGKTDQELWEEWRHDITARYAEQVKALGPQKQGQKLTSKGFYNYHPRWDAKGEGIFFVSNTGRDDFRAGLGYVKLADTSKKEEERFKPIPGVRGYFDVAPDDSTFLFASAKETDRHGVHKLDLYQRNLRRKAPFFERRDPTKKRFTKELNAAEASYSPDGTRIAFVRAERAGFRLCTALIPMTVRELADEEIRVLFPTDSMLRGRFGFNVYTPKFSPDGTRILFSYFDGDSRNIGLVNADGSGFAPILSRSYDERDPEWAPDGKSFFFASDTSGIYNLYRYDLDSGSAVALTQVTGGAFAPAVDSSGTKIAYIQYDADGFSLYLLRDLKPAAAVAPASRPSRAPAPETESIELAGHSEPYMPVPTRGILTPMIIGEEFLSRTREAKLGEAKWLVGAQGYLNDPVLKNELGGALLVEVGKGLDYFGAHDEILSPDKESQFFVALSNHSTPVTLGLDFGRGNLTTHDTIRIKDVNGTGDRVERQNYALTFRQVGASAAYNLFDADAVGDAEQTSSLRLSGGYGWNDFNFYDLGDGVGFAFTYYRNLYFNALVNLVGAEYDDKGLVAPSGMVAALSYTVSQSDIVRNGTFEETFVFNSNGTLTPRYRSYILHDLEAGATYGMPLPWSKHSALVASGFIGSLLDWSLQTRDPGHDTLDSFFAKGLVLRGYPYLRNSENLAFSGENTATLSVDLNQPIWPDLYARFWTVLVEDLYVDLFWETGRAWNGALWDTELFSPSAWNPKQRPDGWYQTLGASLKVNAVIYHNYPFLAYFEAASGLSGIPDGKGGLVPVESIKAGSFDTHTTRISFGVVFGLYNGLLGRNQAARHPLNPRSSLAPRHGP